MTFENYEQVLGSPEWKKFLSSANNGKDTNKIAFVILGGPGSGKSTIKENVFKERGSLLGNINTYVELDPDKILTQFFKTDNTYRPQVSPLFHTQFANTISEGFNLILDKIGDDPGFSDKYLIPLKEKGYTIHLCLILNNITSALARVESRQKNTGRDVPRDYLIKAYIQFEEKIPFYLEKNCSEIDFTYVYDNSGAINEHKLLYIKDCTPRKIEPEGAGALEKTIESINAENAKYSKEMSGGGGFKTFYEGFFSGSYPKYNGDYSIEFNKVEHDRDTHVLSNLKTFCNTYPLPRFINNFFKGRPSQHRMGIILNPDAYKFINVPSLPDVCILFMPSPKYLDISNYLKDTNITCDKLEKLEEQISCFQSFVKTSKELSRLKKNPQGITLITWFITKEQLSNLESGIAAAENELKEKLSNAFFKGEKGKNEFRKILLEYIIEKYPDSDIMKYPGVENLLRRENFTSSAKNLWSSSHKKRNISREVMRKRSNIPYKETRDKKYSSILDLDGNDVPLLKTANKVIDNHLRKYYMVKDSDYVKKYFHFPYGVNTITLHLHVRINQALHPCEFFRSFQLEDLISQLPSNDVFEIIRNRLPFNIGPNFPGMLDQEGLVKCFKPKAGDTNSVRSLRLIPNSYIIGCNSRDGYGNKKTKKGKWADNKVKVNLNDYTKNYTPPSNEHLTELSGLEKETVLKEIIRDITPKNLSLCKGIISVYKANPSFKSLLDNGCQPTYLRTVSDGGTITIVRRNRKRNKSKLLKPMRKRFNYKTKKK